MEELLNEFSKMLEEMGYKDVEGLYISVEYNTKKVFFSVVYLARDKNGEFIKALNGQIMKRLQTGEFKCSPLTDQPLL